MSHACKLPPEETTWVLVYVQWTAMTHLRSAKAQNEEHATLKAICESRAHAL